MQYDLLLAERLCTSAENQSLDLAQILHSSIGVGVPGTVLSLGGQDEWSIESHRRGSATYAETMRSRKVDGR